MLAIVDQTGAYKAYGTQELLGLQSAVAYYNSHGGINGSKISVTVLNDNGDAATASNLAVKELTSNPTKYSMVYAGSESAEVDALVPIMTRFKQMSVSIADGGACVKASACPYSFILSPSASLGAKATAGYFQKMGYKKVGLLEESVPYTEAESQPLTAALDAVGIQHAKASFSSTSVDVSPQLNSLQSSGVDAVYAEALGPAAGYALAARAKLGWNVPLLFDPAASSLDITTLAPADQLVGASVTVLRCGDPTESNQGLDLMHKYVPSPLTGSTPCNIAGAGWDSIVALSNAVKQAKSTNSDALVKALQNLTSTASNDPNWIIYPPTRWSSDDHENIGPSTSVYRFVAAGRISNNQVQASGSR